MPAELDITVIQGKTFELALMYAETERVYMPITGVPSLAPVRLTVPNHGLPDGWPFDIECVQRPDELNGRDYIAKVIDQDTIEINRLQGQCWPAWKQSGIISFSKPADITGWAARSTWRKSVNSDEHVLRFHSDPLQEPDGLIILDEANSTFTLTLSAEAAEQLSAMTGVFDIEAIDPEGRVFPLTSICNFEVTPEVTR